MRTTFKFPIASVKGRIGDGVYIREYAPGRFVIQHCPKMMSPVRIASCQAFGETFGTARKGRKKGDPTECSVGGPLVVRGEMEYGAEEGRV